MTVIRDNLNVFNVLIPLAKLVVKKKIVSMLGSFYATIIIKAATHFKGPLCRIQLIATT